jgi:hypothetical protein
MSWTTPFIPNPQSWCFCGHGSAQHDAVNGCPMCPDHHLLSQEKPVIPTPAILGEQP